VPSFSKSKGGERAGKAGSDNSHIDINHGVITPLQSEHRTAGRRRCSRLMVCRRRYRSSKQPAQFANRSRSHT
jgi:hypothetical protein